MIKRTIEISQDGPHVSIHHDQLVLKRKGELIASIPCEDIGTVVVDHVATTYTHGALTRLAQGNSTVVLCGSDHLPRGVLLPISDHSEVAKRIRIQVESSRPLQKRLWKQLVQAKIRGQAANLDIESNERLRLLAFADDVRSGDTTNREAQAARLYWQSWLTTFDETENSPVTDNEFRRQRFGNAPNALLNYGYAIIRAAVARAVVSAGLHPALGLHHSNRSNAFCLADDLMEPLRPMVDSIVRDLHFSGHEDVCRETKEPLLAVLTNEVQIGDLKRPLMTSLHRMVATLVACFEGRRKWMEIPIPCN